MKRSLHLLAVAAACASACTHAADWPTFMGGPQRTGHVAQAALDPARLKLAWRFDVHGEVRASPVAVGDTLFVASENGNLYAIDLGSQRLKWLYHAAGGIGSTPAVADGAVYVLSRDGVLHAVAADTGLPVWRFRTGGESAFSAFGMYGAPLEAGPFSDPWDFYLSSPLVHQGKVYVGSSDARVYALDVKTGKLAWTYRTGGAVHSSPALAGPNIVVGSWDGAVYALDAASGELRWRYQTETEQQQSIMLGVQASASADAGSVYIGSRDGCLYALDARSGKLNWRHDAKGAWIAGTAAQDGQSVYVGTSDSNLLLALDKRSGQERYRFNTQVWTFASPLRVGEHLVAATMKGQLHVLDAATGKQRWSWRTPQSQQDGYRVLDPKTGGFDSERLYRGGLPAMHAALEHVKRLGAFIASPLWHNGRLIAVSATGEVHVFDAASRR